MFALLAISCSALDCIGRWLMFELEHDFRALFTSIEGISMTTDSRVRGNAPRTLHTPDSSHAPVATNNTNCISFCHSVRMLMYDMDCIFTINSPFLERVALDLYPTSVLDRPSNKMQLYAFMIFFSRTSYIVLHYFIAY